MKLEHLALWTSDPARLREFYCRYFGAAAGPESFNPRRNFRSCFLTFEGGARLELMTVPKLAGAAPAGPRAGLAHFAFSAGSREAVDSLTARLAADGFKAVSGPRVTGDGYYESCVPDPDGNLVEIVF